MIGNIKIIAYKLKSREERMQTQEFIVVRRNPAYIHSPQPPNRVRVPPSFQSSYNWIMVPIHPLRLLAPSTLYNSQEISLS